MPNKRIVFLLVGVIVALLLAFTAQANEPQSYTSMKRSYMDWPDVLAVGEKYQMKGYRNYYKGSKLLERQDVTNLLVYTSSDEKIVKVLPGNILVGVGVGECTLRIEETDKGQIWRTSKTIAVADRTFSVKTGQRTKAEIEKRYESAKPTFTYNAQTEQFGDWPNVNNPYKTGSLKSGVKQDGLKMASFVRWLAGLPDQLVLDANLNEKAQHGAVVLAAIDELTHEPGRPLGMNRNFYKTGYASTTSSNISSGVDTLSEQVAGFMDDLGLHNLSKVGHRRWILNPPLKKIGFGLAYARNGVAYGVMQVFDRSDAMNVKVVYDYMAWPSAGFFPTQFFNGLAPWSITPNPERYDLSQSENLSIQLTDVTNKRGWTLNSNDYTISESGNFFNVDISEGGMASAIVFRPQQAKYKDGSVYRVRIKNLVHRIKGPTSIEYEVKFFALSNWKQPDGWSKQRETMETGENPVVPSGGAGAQATTDSGAQGNTGGSGGSGGQAGSGGNDSPGGQKAESEQTGGFDWRQFVTTAQDTFSGLKHWELLAAGLGILVLALLFLLFLLRSKKM